jgi:lysozyme family protein
MTEDELIDGILEHEGGFVNDRVDHGGVTNFGITAAAWGQYKQLNRPGTTAEMKAITRDDAIEFYRQKYIVNGAFKAVAFEPLRAQLIDFAVNSVKFLHGWINRAVSFSSFASVNV